MVGEKAGLGDDVLAPLGAHGAAKVFRAEGPEGLSQPVVDAMAKVIGDGGHGYALFGGGLLGFEIGAGLAARLDAGVCMEVTEVVVKDGKLVARRPILKDSQVSDVHYRSDVGVIIGRLNAFEIKETGGSTTVEDLSVEFRAHSLQAKMVQRGEQRGAEVNIEDADILVAGGRGLGNKESFQLLEDLAGALGGAVAATAPPIAPASSSSCSKPSALPRPRPPATRMSASSMFTSAPRCSLRSTITAFVEWSSNWTSTSTTSAEPSPDSSMSNAFSRPMMIPGSPT